MFKDSESAVAVGDTYAVPKTKAPKAGSFWDRLKEASEVAGEDCTPTSIARELGINVSAVTKYVNGGRPHPANAEKLAKTRHVRADWLMWGQGPMLSEGDMDDDTKELLKIWRDLDGDAKQRFLGVLRYEYSARQLSDTGRRAVLTEEIVRRFERKQPQ